MNNAAFIGTICADASVKTSREGEEFTSFDVAVNYHRKGGTTLTTFVSCAMNGRNENLLPYLKKGQKVYVAGRISCRAYVDRQNHAKAALTLSVREGELV